MDYDSVALVRR